MSWMDKWYEDLRKHNMKECIEECRHCAREKDQKDREGKARIVLNALCDKLKYTEISFITCDYDGGYDEDFIDYADFYDANNKSIRASGYDEDEEPWKTYKEAIVKVGWLILGHGFGVGEFSTHGTFKLDIINRKLFKNNEVIMENL